MHNGYDLMAKVVLVGDSGVGKTNLLLRYVNDQFFANSAQTIGVDFKVKTIELDGKRMKMQIWDTAGQDRFRSITAIYFKGATGIILVYDVTDERSFNNLENWMERIDQSAASNVKIILIGNKSDTHERDKEVSTDRGKEFAARYEMRFFETSAKTSHNVAEAFEGIAAECMADPGPFDCPGNVNLDPDPAPDQNSCCTIS
jgi:Ras-related protein Rab-8A